MASQHPTGHFPRLAAFLRTLTAMRIPFYAAGAGFFIVLSAFPGLVLLLGLLRYTGLRIEALLDLLEGILPEALVDIGEAIVIEAYQGFYGTLVGLSALTGLWSAGRGIYGLLTGLNAVYGIRETRGYFHTRFICAAYTFAFLLMLLLTLVVRLFGRTLLAVLDLRPGSFPAFLARTLDFQGLVLLAIQSLIFALMFMVLPNHRVRFRESLPGAVLASIGWMIFSELYSVYVENFAPLSSFYGSVYVVALGMLWLYLSISILFYGGALNRFLRQKRERHG